MALTKVTVSEIKRIKSKVEVLEDLHKKAVKAEDEVVINRFVGMIKAEKAKKGKESK